MVASDQQEVSVKNEQAEGSPSSSTSKDDKGKVDGSPRTGPSPVSGSVVPPYPPPPVHHPAVHYYHPYPPPPPGYDHSLPQTNGAEGPARGIPPPGPYTAAQYEMRKQQGSSLPLPHYPGPAAPPAAPAAANNTNKSSPAGSQPSTSPRKNATESPTGPTPSRDPPPPPHPYHHPGVPPAGEHGPPPPHPHHPHLHHPPYPPPFRGDEHHMGPPPPHHRAWGEYGHYYEGGPHPYPPPPPLPAHYRGEGRQPPPLPNDAGPLGPYRFSDTTLRREALSHLRAKRAQQTTISASSSTETPSEADARDGATSPSQIESSHREEVTTMGCTCKKTKCLKLYCQCFAVRIYCGPNCRCMVCQNTMTYERERQEAIRNILSRNPQAFDTKFKKSVPDTLAPELAHKLGCKCRKSACMKKYCECYAGSVKCSDNCRCVGCKNVMGQPGPFPPPPPPMMTMQRGPGLLVAAIAAGEEPRKREPYMMNAAQNLAFLKHASPAADKSVNAPRRTPSQDGESSMPSLASEESPPSGEQAAKVDETRSIMFDPTTAEKTAVNALLMAAFAMTEMSGHSSTGAAEKQESTPPASNSTTPPDIRNQSMEEGDYKTPQKNLLKQFQSPKRKKAETEESPVDLRNGAVAVRATSGGESSSESSSPSGTADDNDDSPKRELSEMTDLTPSVQQKTKKSRIGSVRKPGRILEMAQASPMVVETPRQVKDVSTKDLTPVSARCIDFKRMHVHENHHEPSNNTSPQASAVTEFT